MISVRLTGQPSICMWQKLNVVIFSDTINVMNIKLCIMGVLTELYPFIPLSVTLIVSRSHWCPRVLIESYLCLSNELETLYNCWFRQVDNEYATIFDFRSYFRERINTLPCLNFFFFNIGLFSDTHWSKSFQILHDFNLPLGLHCHFRFDDLDFVSRWQVC